MNLKKFVSAASALTIAASAFAGMAVTASAAETKTSTVDAMQSWNASKGTVTLENNRIFGQSGLNTQSSNYPGIGVVRLSVDAVQDAVIQSAALTYNVKHSQNKTNEGTYDAYTVENPTTDFASIPFYSSGEEVNDGIFKQTGTGTVWDYSGILGSLEKILTDTTITNAEKSEKIDVTDYLKAQTAVGGKYYTAFAFSNANRGVIITNPVLTVQYADATAVEKDITINYVYGDDNTAIPTASLPADTKTSDKAYSGTSYKAEYPQTFDANAGDTTYRYTYAGESGDDTITVSADGSNTITLKYTRKALTYVDVSVKAVDTEGKTIKSFVEDHVIEGTSVDYKYPIYLTDSNNKVIYKTDETSYSGKTAESKTIEYKPYNGTAYFVEGENVIKSSGWIDNAKLSSGRAIRSFTEATVMTVPKTGEYTLTVCALTNGVNKGSNLKIYKNTVSADTLLKDIDLNYASVNKIETVTLDVKTYAENDQIIAVASESNTSLDYMLLTEIIDSAVEVSEVQTFTTHDDDDYTVFKALVKANSFAVKGLQFEDKEDQKQTTEIAQNSEAVFIVTYNKAAITNPSVTVIN